jgi:hypothetical protein
MADLPNSAPIGASKTDDPLLTGTDSDRDNRPDAVILAAFERYQQGHLALQGIPDKQAPGQAFTEGETRLWAIIDAADVEVQATPATTPAGIASKLWIALVHCTQEWDIEQAAIHRNLTWCEAQGDKLDWHVRLLVSALRDLAELPTSAGEASHG